MHLVLISPEGEDARETAVLGELFAAGLTRYHVRKPTWSSAQLEAWVRSLPVEWRPRMVFHQHHELVAVLGLGGCHWRDESGTGVPPVYLCAHEQDARATFTSRSCHDLATLRAALGYYDAVFFGPVFSSISKPGHGPIDDATLQQLSTLLAQRTPAERRTAVLALGGVTADRLTRCAELGFDGVALLGAVWQAADPLAAFNEFQTALHCHAT
jgi:thiamine-phosphate pyrophosphorylase